MKRNAFLTFCFSLIPGAGQMYQGYMKRGLSLILLFVLPFMVGAVIMPALMSLSAVVYMYSFFDSMNIHSRLKLSGTEVYEKIEDDDYLVHLDALLSSDLKKLSRGKHHLLGWGFIAVGVLALYQTFLLPMLESLLELLPEPMSWDLIRMIRSLPSGAVAVALVLLGIWLIRGPKHHDEEDYPSYKGEEK